MRNITWQGVAGCTQGMHVTLETLGIRISTCNGDPFNLVDLIHGEISDTSQLLERKYFSTLVSDIHHLCATRLL